MSYLHHCVFFYELIVAGCECQVPVYTQCANKRNSPEHVVHGCILKNKYKLKTLSYAKLLFVTW